MHSFTPRTCLWPLTGALLVTFALSIGLTFRSNHHCFAGVCGEWLFPLQARLHVIIWYSWLALSVTVLALRAFQPRMRAILRKPLIDRKLPVLGKQLNVSGVLVLSWILVLYGVLTAIWWHRLDNYFERRGQGVGETLNGNKLLAAIAQTGHYADVSMGLALIPVSRHSALASFFKLSVSTTLAFHMLTAYTLFMLVLIHIFLYIAWIASVDNLYSKASRVFPVLNPTYLYNEVWPGNNGSLEIWRASLIFTGAGAALIMAVLSVTTVHWIRLHHFNLFYFTHLFSIVAVIIVCLHASTLFYCTAPGLAMIVLDWGMRLYELRQSLPAKVVDLTRGWYMVSLELPRHRMNGCACRSPLAHFYIHHGTSSLRELHPFTTITHLASQSKATPHSSKTMTIEFLFRRQGVKQQEQLDSSPAASTSDESARVPGRIRNFVRLKGHTRKTPHVEWTARLAGLVAEANPQHQEKTATSLPACSPREECESESTAESANNRSGFAETDTRIRLEGPYFTSSDPSHYSSVLCLVAGTGVSGALAIAAAFAARDQDHGQQIHDGKSSDKADNIPFAINEAVENKDHDSRLPHARDQANSNISVATDPTQTASDPDHGSSIRTWTSTHVIWSVRSADYITLPFPRSTRLTITPYLTGTNGQRLDMPLAVRQAKDAARPIGNVWVYISGPAAFIAAAEKACKEEGVDYYGARWDI